MLMKFITFFIISFFSFSNKLEVIQYEKTEKEILTSTYYTKKSKSLNHEEFIIKSLNSNENDFHSNDSSKILMMRGHNDNHYIRFTLKNLSSSDEILIAGWFEPTQQVKIYWLENGILKNKDLEKFYKQNERNDIKISLHDRSILLTHPRGEA